MKPQLSRSWPTKNQKKKKVDVYFFHYQEAASSAIPPGSGRGGSLCLPWLYQAYTHPPRPPRSENAENPLAGHDPHHVPSWAPTLGKHAASCLHLSSSHHGCRRSRERDVWLEPAGSRDRTCAPTAGHDTSPSRTGDTKHLASHPSPRHF